MKLFEDDNPKNLNLPDAEVAYYPNLIAPGQALNYYNTLLKEVPWQQDDIKVFGKVYSQPRLTALYGNNEKPYSYSNITMKPLPFTPLLLKLKEKVEQHTSANFTTCLLNLYRDGRDSNGWHADDEKELGEHPIIASVSLGASRWFHLKHKKNKELKTKILLESGSLLLMQGETQKNWLHQIPKSKKVTDPRINLTFRVIK
ncbi:alpha-ketoglutarate-dependent dioxygenase AlkB family protein [Aquimarina brevivitae]|uniref:Alkylated DNA repair dioxygenase AlkB n=1 Tax=Aquimarina brevivitae TaxID=323412 RepID=A0A4Q7P0A9_9FLAO|nr:alpha-ketoglutarate-dependent dioxygenase AlkB [Aquimarina brevivitae]RZS93115.1 alkylated DNA repair dioxygenase AlkB [Aquimarina brevivitae]